MRIGIIKAVFLLGMAVFVLPSSGAKGIVWISKRHVSPEGKRPFGCGQHFHRAGKGCADASRWLPSGCIARPQRRVRGQVCSRQMNRLIVAEASRILVGPFKRQRASCALYGWGYGK